MRGYIRGAFGRPRVDARVFAVAAVLAFAFAVAAEDAAALKSAGSPALRSGSDTAGIVCGDRLCSEAPREPAGGERAAEPAMQEPADAEKAHPERDGASMVELAPDVYSYFLNGYNSLVVVSEDGVLVTDPSNDERAAAIKEAVAGLTAAPVTWIVMSHEHYDHAGGFAAFQEAQIACHRNCQPVFDLDPFGTAPESVDLEFDDFAAIEMGGITVELHYLAPGDGDATAVVYLPAEQVMFTADIYEPRALTHGAFMDDSNSTGRQKILDTVSEWPLRHAITSHSPDTDPAAVYENAQFLNDLKAAVLEAVAASEKPGFAAVLDTYLNPGSVRLPQYSDWQGYEEHIDRHVQRMVMSMYHGD